MLRGHMFVLGNTGVGKSSFVHTLKKYSENPTLKWLWSRPEPFLTGDEKNKNWKETKVMEVVRNLNFKNRFVTKAGKKTEEDHSKLTIIEIANEEAKSDSVIDFNVTDFGGE